MSNTWNSLLNHVVFGGTHPYSCTCAICSPKEQISDTVLEDIWKSYWKDSKVTDFTTCLEMPGVKKENISVKFRGDTLCIRYTDRFGSVKTRDFLVSSKIYAHDFINCQYDNGLLSIVVPLRSEQNPLEPPEIPVEIK